jgi:hypothetical protein
VKSLSLLAYSLTLAALCGLGCKSAQVTSEQELAPPSAGQPVVVYVTDFEIGVVKHEEGILSERPGPLGRIGERLYGTSSDPAARAQQIVDLMANSLVKDLSKLGFNALRPPAGRPIPTEGWLVRGIFTEVQEGNRLQRAMIGFAQGQTDIQVVTTIDDLSHGPPKPLYELATNASSGNTPGAAPTLVLGPYGAAARFVMAGEDLDKNVRQTAVEIAEELAKCVQQGAHPDTTPSK